MMLTVPFAYMQHQRAQDRYTKVKTELDIKKRDQLVKEFGLFVREEAAVVFLVFANEPYGASKKVGNWPTIRIRPPNIDMITHP